MITILLVFGFVYLGMILGGIPGLALDRTGVALLGAIVLLAGGAVTPEAAWRAIDVPTIGLLFGLMVVSAQFRLSGFYSHLTWRIGGARVPPGGLLALVIGAAGLLSALLANDIVCLAMAPILVEACARRGLNPVPFALALACAANVGSAATLIGNPQNMLIGQALNLSFSGYLLDGGIPALLGLAFTWLVFSGLFRRRWHRTIEIVEIDEAPAYDRWQTLKGGFVLAGLVIGFLFTPMPREVLALAGGGILLASRRMASRNVLGLVDWHLLVLFGGLFIVNHALADSGLVSAALESARGAGIDPTQPAWLFVLSVGLSNLVSNVPAVMLLLPAATHPLAGPVLALASTLAGNLIIVGSIANIIVVDQAARVGVPITWREHARLGVPVTLVTLAVAALWLTILAAAQAQ